MIGRIISRLKRCARPIQHALRRRCSNAVNPFADYLAKGLLRIDAGGRIMPDATVNIAPRTAGAPLPALHLGAGAFVMSRASLDIGGSESMAIGPGTSIHEGCSFHDNVRIGAHCLFSKHIFISSGNHHYDLDPALLIRDQDELAQSRGTPSAPVTVGDDCWIGWGAFIHRGVHIGRGAVIGAYTVVSRDVEPYAVHAGIPNRLLKTRLIFDPPAQISATTNADNPYFYSGFALGLRDRLCIDKVAMVAIRETALIVLRRGPWRTLRLQGGLLAGVKSARVRLASNCFPTEERVIDSPRFEMSLPYRDGVEDDSPSGQPSFLLKHCLVSLKVTGTDAEGNSVHGPSVALASASLH